MNNAHIRAVLREQLALDLGCGTEILDAPGNTVLEWRDLPGRRKYDPHPPKLEIALWDGKLVCACAPELLPWAEEFFQDLPAEWLISPKYLRQIDAALGAVGYEIGEARRYFTPTLPWPEARPICPVRWHEADELEPFRGDTRWDGPLAFDPLFPDMLAVAALDERDEPIAMAGVSRDGEKLWQIGIVVLPEFRGKGLAVNLTALIKDELLRRGIVPFYGTAESHIVSLNVAVSAGLRPSFAYLHAIPRGYRRALP